MDCRRKRLSPFLSNLYLYHFDEASSHLEYFRTPMTFLYLAEAGKK